MAVNSLNERFNYLLRFESNGNELIINANNDCLNVCSKLDNNYNKSDYYLMAFDSNRNARNVCKTQSISNKSVDIDSDGQFGSPGMKEVPKWLKMLRLHKYSHLFSGLTYDQLLATTEDQLQRKNVTKGARNKLINSIEKLRQRPQLLTTLEAELIENGFRSVGPTLTQLNAIASTPFRAYDSVLNPRFTTNLNYNRSQDFESTIGGNKSGNNCLDEDLPEVMTRLLGIVVEIVMKIPELDDNSFNLFGKCIDKCVSNSAFSLTQKIRLNGLKKDMQNVYTIEWIRRSSKEQIMRTQSNSISVSDSLPNFISKTYDLCDSTLNSVLFDSLSNRISVPQLIEPKFINTFETHLTTHPIIRLTQHSKNNLRPIPQSYRTNLTPVLKVNSNEPMNHLNAFEREMNGLNETERLCIRMTEQALGLSDGGLYLT